MHKERISETRTPDATGLLPRPWVPASRIRLPKARLVAGFAAVTFSAAIAWAATVYSSYGATNTSNMVDGSWTTYGVLQPLTGISPTPTCPPGFSYWLSNGPPQTRGCIKGLSSSWKIMGWTLIDLGPDAGTSCGSGCTRIPRLRLTNQGDGNPNASSCTPSTPGCTAKFRVFSAYTLSGGSTSWTHRGSYDVEYGGIWDQGFVTSSSHRYWLIARQPNGLDESDPRVNEAFLHYWP